MGEEGSQRMSGRRVLAVVLLGWVLWLNVQDRWLIITPYETEAECRKATALLRGNEGARLVCVPVSTELPDSTIRPGAPLPPRFDEQGRAELET
jgi:hypothetical protein